MTHKEKEETRQAALDVAHGEMIRRGMFRSCLNCEHWEKGKENECSEYETTPPGSIIVFGCDDWEIEIPF